MKAIRIEFWYARPDMTPEEGGFDKQVELFVSGPGATVGHVHDVLTGADYGTNPDDKLDHIRIYPNSELPERLKQ